MNTNIWSKCLKLNLKSKSDNVHFFQKKIQNDASAAYKYEEKLDIITELIKLTNSAKQWRKDTNIMYLINLKLLNRFRSGLKVKSVR